MLREDRERFEVQHRARYTYQRGADNLNFVKGSATTNLNASGWYEQE